VAVLAVVGVAVGWWLAGRVLLPLKRITGTARHLSSANLDERIGLDGPADELKRLADTFDEMLDRLERSFEGQRRFIANVSHELRTPLAVQRTALELGLLEPTAADVARVRSELLAANRRTERLIDGLLTLARSDCGPLDRQPVALDEIVRQAADQNAPAARAAGVRVELALEPATVNGEASLLLQLAANLIQNGVRHNHRGGCVRAEVSPAAGLRVTNTGPVVPEERLGQLFEPFARLGPARTGSDDEGAGLGLSIVWSICHVHEVPLRAVCQPGGGLDIRVPFRAVLPADPPALSAPATRQAS
jgi:signal transduction histidine kinase